MLSSGDDMPATNRAETQRGHATEQPGSCHRPAGNLKWVLLYIDLLFWCVNRAKRRPTLDNCLIYMFVVSIWSERSSNMYWKYSVILENNVDFLVVSICCQSSTTGSWNEGYCMFRDQMRLEWQGERVCSECLTKSHTPNHLRLLKRAENKEKLR